MKKTTNANPFITDYKRTIDKAGKKATRLVGILYNLNRAAETYAAAIYLHKTEESAAARADYETAVTAARRHGVTDINKISKKAAENIIELIELKKTAAMVDSIFAQAAAKRNSIKWRAKK